MYGKVEAIVAVRNGKDPEKLIQQWAGCETWPLPYRWSSPLIELSGQLIDGVIWVINSPVLMSVSELLSINYRNTPVVLIVPACDFVFHAPVSIFPFRLSFALFAWILCITTLFPGLPYPRSLLPCRECYLHTRIPPFNPCRTGFPHSCLLACPRIDDKIAS